MTNWNDLPWEMKEMVVTKMDVFTRFRLKLCSKSDKFLVESTPVRLKEVEYFSEPARSYLYLLSPNINFHADDLKMNKQSEYIYVMRDPKEKSKTLKFHCEWERYDMFHKYINEIVFKGKAEIVSLKINVPYPQFRFASSSIKVKELTIVKNAVKWLDHIAPSVNKVTLVEFDSRYIVRFLQTLNAKHVEFDHCEIDPISINCLKATTITLIKDNRIHEWEVRRLIKKWIAEDYPVGSSIQTHLFPSAKSPTNLCTLLELVQNLKDIRHCPSIGFYIRMRRGKYMTFKLKDSRIYVDITNNDPS